MSDHGFSVAGFDLDKEKVASLLAEAQMPHVYGANTIVDFLKLLRKPRVIMLLVPAGKPVDSVIDALLPHLQAGDLIIDAGNSHFTDTNIRATKLAESNIQFLGVGISGGEEGARLGPSIMPGGPKEAYEKVRAIFEAVAAKVNGAPCVTYLGTGSVGHYVKMVHNGIEYGIMQLIAETYDVMKRGLRFDNAKLHEVYKTWNEEELNSYLIEITSHIFKKKDEKTNQFLIDKIKSVAKQNGTGMWTSQSAMELQVPTPTIDVAVSMRDMSVLVKEREHAAQLYPWSQTATSLDANILGDALYSAMFITYAQGMALLTVASQQYMYQLDLEAVARIWRGGCIIRAKMLDDICEAFRDNHQLANLLLAPNIAHKIKVPQENLRLVVSEVSLLKLPAPALMASLAYFDAYRSEWSAANLIQAQRDYFGSHTYERIDMSGTFHTEWEKN
jgi:6-phosphogluconate dehydrogenase